MLRLFDIRMPYYAEADGNEGSLGKDGILDLLNEEDDDTGDELDLNDKTDKNKPPSKQEDKEADDEGDNKDDKDNDEDDETDELDELEEELEDPDEEDLELVTPVRRKEILAKYPDIFKDFPYLEKAYYREQKYTEIFPTLDDAKTARESADVLKDFENKILEGDTSTILKVVKEENPDSFNKLVDNYLSTLKSIDNDAFIHVVSSIVKPIIYNLVQAGTENKDEDYKTAARVLNQFLYGSTKWEPHKPLAKSANGTENKEAEDIKAERAKLAQERFDTAKEDVNTRTESTFRKAIDKHIDPKGEMSPYIKRQAARDAYESLTELLNKDNRVRSLLDKAWRKASEKGFDKDSVAAIRQIINTRAQTVLPSVIKKARIEALRGMGKRVRNDNDKETNNNNKDRSTSSPNRGPLKPRANDRSSSQNNKNEIPRGMSNKDFIMND